MRKIKNAWQLNVRCKNERFITWRNSSNGDVTDFGPRCDKCLLIFEKKKTLILLSILISAFIQKRIICLKTIKDGTHLSK